jgi:hypothetical protein
LKSCSLRLLAITDFLVFSDFLKDSFLQRNFKGRLLLFALFNFQDAVCFPHCRDEAYSLYHSFKILSSTF